MFSLGQIFYVSRCTLKIANKQYSNLKNDYEMTFNNDTVIEKCEDAVDLPCMTFDFVPINEMEKHQPNSIVGKLKSFCVCFHFLFLVFPPQKLSH